jgi:hypothetical protein
MKNNKKEATSTDILLLDLKMLIRENLKFCDDKSTPFLCAYKETEEGYKDIEDFCIKAFFETDMDVSEALVMKENLLNPNYFID